ncbi:hypothetical protein GUJ93_ZPchr0458g22736 [Zizania palustris]|uniref:Uncharacterized protein n=1 Tax=Zizania palustris TaxID=103762 RepID=A0A8J5R2E5_ZIZPA|nr:hypothetical protein GUJ93_ZPchr0458g22482 [Zizania palustris]KAG8044021.1 hypothetical protein GUJ93_ZPchr0458g22736 [Zizania palustris]
MISKNFAFPLGTSNGVIGQEVEAFPRVNKSFQKGIQRRYHLRLKVEKKEKAGRKFLKRGSRSSAWTRSCLSVVHGSIDRTEEASGRLQRDRIDHISIGCRARARSTCKISAIPLEFSTCLRSASSASPHHRSIRLLRSAAAFCQQKVAEAHLTVSVNHAEEQSSDKFHLRGWKLE